MPPRVVCLNEHLPSWNHFPLFFLSNKSPSLTHNPCLLPSAGRGLSSVVKIVHLSGLPAYGLRSTRRKTQGDTGSPWLRPGKSSPRLSLPGSVPTSPECPVLGRPRLPSSGSSRSLRPLPPGFFPPGLPLLWPSQVPDAALVLPNIYHR